jgi:adenosylcobyric acid synthase
VVEGRPLATMTALEYHEYKPRLLELVLDALADLRARFDIVCCEGAGSPAEINLLDHDIVNLRVAHEARIPAVVVGDIDLGGVFAALYGTVALLPQHFQPVVRGFVINKFRGDPALLLDGCAELHRRSGVPTLGVVPWLDDVDIDAEDSLALRGTPGTRPALGDVIDVAVLRLPRISNFTDFDPLVHEPGVHVRFVNDAAGLGRPDLVIVPGTKATVADLAWVRERGFDRALARTDATVLGICGGYQMLGRTIDDRVESGNGDVAGLGLLPVGTTFEPDKVTRLRGGTSLGQPIQGYQIHHGRVHVDGGEAFVVVDGDDDNDDNEGVAVGNVHGTTLHGLFEADAFRRAFLAVVAERAGKRFVPGTDSFQALRDQQIDRLADAFAANIDLGTLTALIASASMPAAREPQP